jgi:sugar lactone lactonase YvrE
VLLALEDVASRPGTAPVGFNDLAADPAGRLFAGVLRRDATGAPTGGELVRVTGEREHVVVHDDLHPNGIGVSPDGSLLYVSDTFGRRLLVFALTDEPPALVDELSTAAVDGLPDGLAVDAEGCKWVAFYRGGCVARFAPDGRIVRRLAVPALKPLSLCIAGDAPPLLYVVTGTREPGSAETGSVYATPIDVPGAQVHLAAI